MNKVIGYVAKSVRAALVSAGAVSIALTGLALANYNMTIPGSGTVFGSTVIGGIHYAQQLILSMPTNITLTACGGTIGTGGTAQNAFTAQTTLQGFTIMNLSADPMWVSFTGTAAVGGGGDAFLLPAASATVAGGSFTAPPGMGLNHALSVIAATTADAYSCVWW